MCAAGLSPLINYLRSTAATSRFLFCVLIAKEMDFSFFVSKALNTDCPVRRCFHLCCLTGILPRTVGLFSGSAPALLFISKAPVSSRLRPSARNDNVFIIYSQYHRAVRPGADVFTSVSE